ncbi:hypothetical protein [Polymorphobacter megasporae]|nr:hypothetical protein [Polymorphobacter megasporae]UAJ12265.1 hypothetical protein KTC28_20770 [Polymorphobacter megasporae]
MRACTNHIVSTVLCALPTVGSQNGFALCHWVRDNNPTIAIAPAGTLDVAPEMAAECYDAGPRLVRPYDPGVIVEQVQLMRERGRQKLALS